jgi:hypothetical protein
MKFLRSWKKFEEVRLSDVLKVSGESEYANVIKDISKSEFDDDSELIDHINLKGEFINRKIKLIVRWNHNEKHDMIRRIKDRTNFNSTSDFNEYFEDKMQKVFPHMIGKEINENGRYIIYDKELKLSIIIDINVDDFIKKLIYKIFVFTIVPLERGGKNIVKVLYI